MLRARSLLSHMLVSCSCIFDLVVRVLCGSGSSFMGRPASPFIGEGKARVRAEEKEKNEREKKASRITRSFFSFMRVPPIL